MEILSFTHKYAMLAKEWALKFVDYSCQKRHKSLNPNLHKYAT